MGIGKSLKKLTRKLGDPLGIADKVLGKIGGQDFANLVLEGPIGNADSIKAVAGSKLGSVLSGRAVLQGGIRKQNMETARTFDVFGSPATAGTKMQTTARASAVIYGAAVGAGALMAGGGTAAAGTSGGVAGGGGVAASGTAVSSVGATSLGSTLASFGKYAALGLTLGRQFGVLPGPGAPGMSPDTIPSENYFPDGLLGAIYPEAFGAALPGFGPGEDADSGGIFSGASGMALIVAAGILLFLIGVVLIRK